MGKTDRSLSPVDLTIWRVFTFYHPGTWEPLAFNEPIITNPTPVAEFTAKENGEWARLLAKRVDVVASAPSALCIIEVKPNGGAQAMGQALTYAALWLKTKNPTVPLEPWVVCDRIDEDAISTYERLGVGLWQAMDQFPRVYARSLVR